MHGRNRGRPPLAPELRRHSRGIRLRSASWDDLKEIAGAYGCSEDLAVEKLIAEAIQRLSGRASEHPNAP